MSFSFAGDVLGAGLLGDRRSFGEMVFFRDGLLEQFSALLLAFKWLYVDDTSGEWFDCMLYLNEIFYYEITAGDTGEIDEFDLQNKNTNGHSNGESPKMMHWMMSVICR